jgi:hypothetical protein
VGITKFDMLHCEELIKHMSLGKSYATFGAVIKVTLTTMKNWEKHISEWADAKELGLLCQMSEWEDIILAQSKGLIKGAPATTIFALKNFFPDQFKENTALIGNQGVTIVIDTGVPSALPDVETHATHKHLDYNEIGSGKISKNTLTLVEQENPLDSFLDDDNIQDAEVVESEKSSKVESLEPDPWDL